jgi:hypothetical protein
MWRFDPSTEVLGYSHPSRFAGLIPDFLCNAAHADPSRVGENFWRCGTGVARETRLPPATFFSRLRREPDQVLERAGVNRPSQP